MAANTKVDASQVPETDAEHEAHGHTHAPGDQSPLNAETPRRRPPKGKKTRTVREREYEEDVSERDAERHDESFSGDDEPKFVDESPLETMAEAALAQAHVTRVGPGTGPGWGPGMAFDHSDGRGPVSVSKGPVGTFQRTADLFEQVIAVAGGARYRFMTKGQPPVEETLPGAPLPLPMERGQPGGGGFGGMGAGTAMPGGFDRGGFGSAPFDRGAPFDPADDPAFDPEQGLAPEDVQRNSLQGWQLNGTTARWIYYLNGVPSRPPRGSRPPVHLMGGSSFGYDPGAFDHSEKKEDSDLKELLKAIVAKIDRPAQDPMAGMAAMMKAQLDADRTRWEKERADADRKAAADLAAAERKAAAEKTEADRRWESDKITRENEFKLVMARLDKEAEKATAIKGNEVEIARINAAAEKDKAAAAVASQEKMQTLQNATTDKLFNVMLKKSDDVGLLERGMRLGSDLKGNTSTVAEVGGLVNDAIPKIVDGVVAIKTLGASGPAGGGGAIPSDDDSMTERFVTLFAQSCNAGADPATMPGRVASACVVTGFDFAKVKALVSLSTPDALAGQLDKQIRAAVSEENRKKFENAKAILLTPEGRAWIAATKAAFAAPPTPPRPALPAPPAPNGAAK